MFRTGVRQALLDQVERARDGSDEIKQIFGSPWKRRLVAQAFEDDAQRNAFDAALGMESRMYGTKQAQLGNSQTASRVAENESTGTIGLPHAMAVASNPWAGAALILRDLLRGQGNHGALANPNVRAEVARRLFSSDPEANRRVLQEVADRLTGNPAEARPPAENLGGANALAGAGAASFVTNHPLPRVGDLLATGKAEQ
jgi:hypothetical protein